MTRQPTVHAAAPWLVLGVGVLFTVGATAFVSDSIRTRDELELDSAARDIRVAIDYRMEAHVALLRAGAGLFAASEDVRLDEFRRFVDKLRLRERFPGLLGIGLSRWFAADEVARVERETQLAGVERFTVWPPTPPREAYSAIVYLEPLDEANRRAIGYDMFTDDVRREAMRRARDTGEPAASGRVVLVQDPDPPQQAPRYSGFLVYVPVYRDVSLPPTVEARRAALEAFVYSPIRTRELFPTVLENQNMRDVVVRVYDGPEADESALLFDSSWLETGPVGLSSLQQAQTVNIAGRNWLVVVHARPEFRTATTSLVPSIFVTGFAVSLILFVLTRAEARARHEAERNAEALRRSKEELDTANRTKDEFLATLSHELRTPLNAILGWTRMLRMGHLDAARQENALEVIERNARVQVRLIEDLLDVSRIITGKLRLELRPVGLAPALDEAASTVRPMAEAKGVTLSCTWDPALGEVVAAPERLQQILWNLLSNAIKFTPRGGRVTLTAARHDHGVRVVVADTGMGIRPDFLPHVFERFRQADSSTTRAHSGVGLGLAIVRHLVELHGGSIEAASPGPDKGSTFTLTLRGRVDGAAAEPTVARVPMPPPTAAGHRLNGLRVLVVDDDEDARTMVATVLGAHGAHAFTAESVRDALAVLDRDRMDVVIVDLAMPGEDGYALLQRLRARGGPRYQLLPTIALTAYARAEDRDAALEQGFQGFLSKPCEPEDLVAMVAHLAGATGQRAV